MDNPKSYIPKTDALLLTVPQAAAAMQTSRDTIYNLCHTPNFPAIRLGRTIRINREGLQRWLNENNGEVAL